MHIVGHAQQVEGVRGLLPVVGEFLESCAAQVAGELVCERRFVVLGPRNSGPFSSWRGQQSAL